VSLARWGDRPLPSQAFIGFVGLALGVVVIAFEVAVRPIESIGGSDVTVYETYGSRMLNGALPYRDFRMEYPPGASPMFLLPATRILAGGSTEGASWSPPNGAARRYYRGFTSFVVLLVGAMVILTAVTLGALRRPAGTVLLSLAVVASSPLLIGQVLLERFDVWPAALTAAALAAAVRERYRLGGMLLGLGAAAKIYPLLLLPVLVIVVIRQRGLREAILVAGTAAAAAAAVFVPFAIASFSDTWESLRVQFAGGLQIESLASSVLVMTAHAGEKLSALGLPSPSDYTTHGAGHGLIRIDLAGPGVGAATAVMSVLLAAVLCLLWVSLARSKHDPREELLRYATATVASVLALGTVLSPQYVVWLIPLVPLVSGRRGTAAILIFVVAAALTNVWIPDRYLEYQGGLGVGPTALLLARNIALLATVVVLLVPGDTLRRSRSVG
jgi:glycosyl transferase family 87